MRISKLSKLKLALLATAVSGVACGQAMAADTQADNTNTASELVVTASRGKPRTVQDSPAPIDVVPAAEIQQSGVTDTKNILQTLLPSYEVQRNANSDAGTFVRPATLRGLPGDDTLVLMDSKRRHRSAAVSASGDGSQAADVAQIPAEAVKSVEVLRDGAAALYGSDAIAGVINFILKDADHGGSMTARYGQYYAGDGQDQLITGNIGLPLTSKGFINATVEYTHEERTSRGVQFCNATFCAQTYAAQNPAYANYVAGVGHVLDRIGQPLQTAVRGILNSGIDFDNGSKFYMFGNYSYSDTHADASYRYPTNGQAVEDVAVRLPDGSQFKYNQLFPYGFTPNYSAKIFDYSAVAGYKGTIGLGSGLTYDFSARYGNDKMQYYISNTVNSTLGPSSPNSFMRAIYVADDMSLDGDFGYNYKPSFLANPINFSFGTEFHREGFQMLPGEPSAYAVGPYGGADPYNFCSKQTNFALRTLNPGAPANQGINCANSKDPVYNTIAALTLTVSPSTAGSDWRNNWAGYAEASSDLTDKLTVDLAGRYESYSDFGDTLNGKASARYKLWDFLGVRGSVGTGFRAPTPGQQIFQNASVSIVNGVITNAGLFPTTNPVAKFLGAQSLRPETSFNLTGGVTSTLFNQIHLSVDYYQINITDQYYSTSPITVTPAITAAMIAANVAGASSISSVSFFQNAFNSKTYGVDVVATDRLLWANGQATTLTGTFNVNSYQITKLLIGNLFDNASIYNFQHNNPGWKGLFTVNHDVGPFSGMVRMTLWGPYSGMLTVANPLVQQFGIEAYFDAEVSYKFRQNYKVSLGARNILNHFPPRDEIGKTTGSGSIYRTDSLEDWQGGFWYLRFDAKF